MRKKRPTPEQIVTLLRQIEVAASQGKSIAIACREAGISDQSYYRWRKEYGGLDLDQARRMKDLEKENSRLKRIQVTPGVIEKVEAPSNRAAREWDFAWPQSAGDLYQVKATDQATEQMLRIPGRKFHATLSPGSEPGESIMALQIAEAPLLSGTLSANDFAGHTVDGWQGSGTFTAQDILGLDELLTANYNGRLHSPTVPADTVGDYASFSMPYGWWTFGITGSESRYQEQIAGSVTAFESLGIQKSVAAWVKRSIHRDASSHTDIQLQLQRRWNRSYIDGTEIGLQHQDLTDMQAAILDSRNFGQAEFDSELAYRQGLPTILGAQEDEPGRTSDLPTSRYKIAVFDVAGLVPLEGPVLGSYHIEARAQYGFNQSYGPDLFAVGGPYSVRGFNPDSAVLGKTGWYVRQELASVPLASLVQPFILVDTGRANTSSRLVAGFGPGLRISWRDFQLMAYAADALSRPSDNKTRCCQLGFNFSYNFSAL